VRYTTVREKERREREEEEEEEEEKERGEFEPRRRLTLNRAINLGLMNS